MTRLKMILWLGLLALLLLTGCASDSEDTTASAPLVPPSSVLDTSYEDALAVRNQLALGTLRLEETDDPVTAEQAAALLPLWQALRGTIGSGASAQAEIDALLRQIEGTMSASQLSAIAAMRLSQADLQTWAQSQGLGNGTRTGVGVGSGQPGSGQSLSAEERATRQAEREGTGGGSASGTSRALLDAVIGLMESR
jgi:hypothetical protein